jgi:hypothetical protein
MSMTGVSNLKAWAAPLEFSISEASPEEAECYSRLMIPDRAASSSGTRIQPAIE